MAVFSKRVIAATGTTSNHTHTGVVSGSSNEQVAVEFVVEAAGATPTVTWHAEGSLNSTDGTDGDWFSLLYITDSSDTAATTAITQTAVGTKVIWLSNANSRQYRWYRVVTASNTNITYRASLYAAQDAD